MILSNYSHTYEQRIGQREIKRELQAGFPAVVWQSVSQAGRPLPQDVLQRPKGAHPPTEGSPPHEGDSHHSQQNGEVKQVGGFEGVTRGDAGPQGFYPPKGTEDVKRAAFG